MQAQLPEIQVLGVKVNPLDISTLHQTIQEIISSNAHELVLHVNIHGINLAFSESWLRNFYNQAKVVFCDGAGVLIGARLLGKHIPQRITYADWMWEFGKFCEDKGYRLFFLGAKPGMAQKAAKRLKENLPGLDIAGIHHGYFDKSPDSPENKAIIQTINQSKAHVLVVGFGMPLQEHWLLQNWEKIETNVALTGGAVFDYISGELARGPKWMTDHNLEWLARLLIEPKRLWKRYLFGNPLFFWRIFMQRTHSLSSRKTE